MRPPVRRVVGRGETRNWRRGILPFSGTRREGPETGAIRRRVIKPAKALRSVAPSPRGISGFFQTDAFCLGDLQTHHNRLFGAVLREAACLVTLRSPRADVHSF